MHSARVNDGKGGWGKEFDHLVLSVELDDSWLVDVGFGDNFIEPLKLIENIPQTDTAGWFKISKHDSKYLKLSRSANNKNYSAEYIFSLKARKWKDFEKMNIYHQTSPQSHFTRNKLCSIALNNGRITLTDNKLIFTKNGRRKITEIQNEADFKNKLFRYLKIKL